MGAAMSGHHNHASPEMGSKRLMLAIVINMILTVVQIVGGVLSGSLALVADAVHNLSDALSLIIAWIAVKIGARPADGDMTFGYRRAEVVAALINYTTLIVIGIYLAYEAILRFLDPQGINGWIVVIIAGVALIIDAGTALLTFTLSKHSMNFRAAFLHNLADALGSVAVIIAGSLILLYDWRWIDPAVTLLIAVYILWMSFSEITPVIRVLMLASPKGIDNDAVLDTLHGADGVTAVHHVHLWQMQEHEAALQARLTLAEGRWRDADAIRAALKAQLEQRFELTHVTLELECACHATTGAPVFGH